METPRKMKDDDVAVELTESARQVDGHSAGWYPAVGSPIPRKWGTTEECHLACRAELNDGQSVA